MNQLSVSFPNELQIDLCAVTENWRRIQAFAPGAECAAVVKADAYGLGSRALVPALRDAGCKTFYVATLDEARLILPLLPDSQLVCLLNGLQEGEQALGRELGLVPVLCSLPRVEAWLQANRLERRSLPCIVQVDTGMNRLGLELAEWQQILTSVSAAELGVSMVMSHLACAEEKNHPLNRLQLQRFVEVVEAARVWAPGIKASFANSGGVLLGAEYHFDQVRTGIALYGGNPQAGSPNHFVPVVRLSLPILQLRRVSEDGSVGYGATVPVRAGTLLATVQGGYADGLLVSQSHQGQGQIAGVQVPMLGRISMDLSVFDVSAVPPSVWRQSGPHFIEVLNHNLSIDAMASAAGTISYEVLTRLGQRFRRSYVAA